MQHVINPDRVKRCMEIEGITATQLSKKSGITDTAISRILNGNRCNPTLKTLKRLSETFGVSIDWLTS